MRKALFTRITIALSTLSVALVLAALFTPLGTYADESIAGFWRASDHSLAVSGGMYNSSPPTLISGAYSNFALDVNGKIILSPTSTVGLALPFSGSSDGQTAAANQAIGTMVWNGTTWDRLSGTSGAPNVAVTALSAPLIAGTAQFGRLDQTVPHYSGTNLQSGCPNSPLCTFTVSTAGLTTLYSVVNIGPSMTSTLNVTCYDSATASGTIIMYPTQMMNNQIFAPAGNNGIKISSGNVTCATPSGVFMGGTASLQVNTNV